MTEENLLIVKKALERALKELQEVWGAEEGDDPGLLDALVIVNKELEQKSSK